MSKIMGEIRSLVSDFPYMSLDTLVACHNSHRSGVFSSLSFKKAQHFKARIFHIGQVWAGAAAESDAGDDLPECAYYLYQHYKEDPALVSNILLFLGMAREATLCPLVQEIKDIEPALAWAKSASWDIRWVTPRLADILAQMPRYDSFNVPSLFIYNAGAVYWINVQEHGEGKIRCEIVCAWGILPREREAVFYNGYGDWHDWITDLNYNLQEEQPDFNALEATLPPPPHKMRVQITNRYDQALLQVVTLAKFAHHRLSKEGVDSESWFRVCNLMESLLYRLNSTLPR